MIDFNNYNFKFTVQDGDENQENSNKTASKKLHVVINDLMGGSTIDFHDQKIKRRNSLKGHLFDKQIEVTLGNRTVYVWQRDLDCLSQLFQKTMSSIFEKCSTDEEIDRGLIELSAYLQNGKRHEYIILPPNFADLQHSSKKGGAAAVAIQKMLGIILHGLSIQSSLEAISKKISDAVIGRLNRLQSQNRVHLIKAQFFGDAQADVDLSSTEVSDRKLDLLATLNNNGVTFQMLYFFTQGKSYEAPLRKVDRQQSLNAIVERIDEGLVNTSVTRLHRFLNPGSWHELADEAEAFRLLSGGQYWFSDLNTIGPLEPETPPPNVGETAHQVFGPSKTRIEISFPGNRIKISGGEANAVSAPQNEADVAAFLEIVGRRGGYITRLALSHEAPGNHVTYFEYVPKKLGQSISFAEVEATLNQRVLLPFGGRELTQYAILDKLTVKKKDQLWEIPVYTYYNWGDRGLPDHLSFVEFIEITTQAEGPEFVHCKAGVGRTGTYLICKYSDTSCKRPKILNDFRAMRHARHKEMIQADYQMAFAFGYLKSKKTKRGEMDQRHITEMNKHIMSKQRPLGKVQESFTLLVVNKLHEKDLERSETLTWEELQGKLFQDIDEQVIHSFLYETTEHVIGVTALLVKRRMSYHQLANLIEAERDWLQKEFGLGKLSVENIFRDHSEIIDCLMEKTT